MTVQARTWWKRAPRARRAATCAKSRCSPIPWSCRRSPRRDAGGVSAMVGRLGAARARRRRPRRHLDLDADLPFVGAATGVQVFVSRDARRGRSARCGPWVWQALAVLVPADGALDVRLIAALLPALLAWVDPSPELQRSRRSSTCSRGCPAARGRRQIAADRVLPRSRRHAHSDARDDARASRSTSRSPTR